MALYSEDTATRSFLPLEEIPSTFSDVIEAQYRETLTELPSFAADRLLQLTQARTQGTMLSKAAALEAISVAGLTGHLSIDDRGITNQALSMLIQRKNEELQRQQTLARARGGVGQGAARLGVALGTSLLDPVNIGLAFVPIVGEARYARILAGAGGAFGRAGVRAGIGAIEGAAGAAIAEPLIYTAKQQEQADYEMADSMMNLAFGTLFGGGLHVVGGAGADVVRRLRGETRWLDGATFPRSELRTFYDERVRGVEAGEPVVNPRFEIGAVAPEVSAQIRAVLPDLPAGADTVRISGRALKHIEEQRPKVAEQIVDRIDEIVLRPDEVLPHPTNSERALLVKQLEPKDNAVTVLEIAEREDGLDVVTIYTAPDRSLRKAREAAAGRMSGLEGQQPAARATDFPHPPSPSVPRTHAAADFPTVSPDEGTIPPPAAPELARDISADASPQVREAALRTAVGQLADGRQVNVEPFFAGDSQAIAQASARAASAPDPDAPRQVEAATAIDEEIAQSNTQLEAAEEEAALAEHLLGDQAKFFELEPKDAATEAAADLTKRAERWSRAAELATACLIRGA